MDIKGPFAYRAHGNIVMHPYKAIYFFIPKVACSSLKIVCSQLLNMKPPDPENPLRYPHKRHFPFVNREEIRSGYRDYFKFVFVRNPWDRLVSCYKNKIHPDRTYNDQWFRNGVADNFWKYGDRFRGGMSFADFVDTVASIPDEQADEHIRSQYLFITDKEGNLPVNFTGRFEKLKDDFLYISKKLGFPPVELPHLLKGNYDHYKTYYNEKTMQSVKDRYQKDIELFGYAF